MIKIINIRTGEVPTFRCDRLSPLGNPYIIRNEQERDEACDLYEEYFNKSLNPDWAKPGFLEYLDKIIQTAKVQDITLGCWCAPKRCHCETIKRYVESQI